MTDADLRRLLEGATEGPWAYRPDEFDDWGVVRSAPDNEGRRWVVCQARLPYKGSDDLNAHRRAGTDPYEADARLIVAAVNALPSHLDRIEALEAALGRLVAAVNTNELAAAMACHHVVSFANVEDALKPALALLALPSPKDTPDE